MFGSADAAQTTMSDQSNYHGGTKRERCYLCDSRGPLEEHHIVPQRFGGRDHKLNIVELCQLCHQRIESLYNKRFYRRLGVSDEKGERHTHRACLYHDCDKNATHTVMVGDEESAYCETHAEETRERRTGGFPSGWDA